MVFVTTTCTMLYIEPVGWVQSQYNEMPSPWGKVLHKLGNSNTKEVLPLLWRFSTTCHASQPGEPTKGLGIPRKSDHEGQRHLIIRLPQKWGEQILQSWRTQTKSCTHQDLQERSSNPTGCWTKLPSNVGGSPEEAWVSQGSPQRQKHWEPQSWKVPLAVNALGGCH